MPNVYQSKDFPTRVYGDSIDEPRKGFSRDLDAIASDALTLPQWRELMRDACPHGYNNFDAAAVALMLAPWGTRCQFFAAREGSVAVYVRGDQVALDNLAISMVGEQRKGSPLAPDEVNFALVPGKAAAPAVRLWWD